MCLHGHKMHILYLYVVCVFVYGFDLPFQQFLAIDVAEILQERERGECVRVTDPDVTCHSLNQTHEVLQLRHNILWAKGRQKDTDTERERGKV